MDLKLNLHKLLSRSIFEGVSPGLIVIGRDSRSEGRGFESRHCILDRHFFAYICCKNSIVCLKRPKINKKRPGLAHFKKEVFVYQSAIQNCYSFKLMVSYLSHISF